MQQRGDGDDPPASRLYPPLVEAAARLAACGHHNQFRKRSEQESGDVCEGSPLPAGCVPYLTHLMGAACILARVGASDEVLAAALLHDYLEDVDDGGEEAILHAAGPEVLHLVKAVTENKRRHEAAQTTWEVRKTESLRSLLESPREAVLIKAADTLHNVLSLLSDLQQAVDPECVWARFNAPPARQTWYFEQVADRVRERLGDHELARDLQRAVSALAGCSP